MSAVYFALASGSFTQNWTNTGLISVSDDWSNVPSIQGFRGDNLTAATGVDPQTLTADDAAPVLDVNANQTAPNTFTTGGVAEFEITNPTIALTGSGTADAPYIVLYLNTIGVNNVNFSFNARDIDGSVDNALQSIAVHYRIGETGAWTNLPAGYLADASSGPSLDTLVTPVSVLLPAAVNNQAQVQVRVMTTNAVGNDEWIGIDDIVVTSGTGGGSGNTISIAALDAIKAEGDSGTTAFTFTVSRTDSAAAATVDFTVTGTGASASDFDGAVLPSGTITIPAGQTSTTLTILVAGDTVTEAAEGFTVTLNNPAAGYTLAGASASGTINNDDVGLTRIYDIQGAAHTSPLNGQIVTTEGIVTALSFNGYFIQDAIGDGNVNTSDGIFVFTSTAPAANITIGEKIRLSGKVQEFLPGNTATNLTVTELTTTTLISESNDFTNIAAVSLSPAGRLIPTGVIDNDNFATFDPAQDAIDFWESLEGMKVTVPNPVAISGTSQFASGADFNEEIWVTTAGGFDPASQNARGGLTISPGDFNPERIQLDDIDRALVFPQVSTGDHLADVTGVVNYDFGNYEVLLSTAPTVVTPGNLQRETTTLIAGAHQVTVAGFNVENLDPGDGAAKFNALADRIVNNLKNPTILALQEIQDNNGATDNGVTAADVTLGTLISAITAAGGPTYTSANIPPANNTSGGEPGGNIRPAFLYDATKVSLLSTTTITDLNPGEADAFAGNDFASSRLPLVGNFQSIEDGVKFTVIDVHMNSKGGDQPLFGVTQPPVLSSEKQRGEQAKNIRDYIQGLLATDPNANIMLIGDVNDFAWSNPALTLESSPLTDLADFKLANPAERYSYVFDGNSQELDHTMVSSNLRDHAVQAFDIVHINAEFSDSNRVSDHDPAITLLNFLEPPVPISNIDLSNYVLTGRYNLPEPTRTTPPANSLLAQEASAVTYNKDTDTLFVVGDGGTSIVQISKTGQLIDSMTLAPGSGAVAKVVGIG